MRRLPHTNWFRTIRLSLFVALLMACSSKDARTSTTDAGDVGDSADDDDGGDGAEDKLSGDFEVDLFRTTSSPVFLLVHDRKGLGVGVLTTKDKFGNPVRVIGLSLIDGTKEEVHLEVDQEGRPILIVTTDYAVRVTSYGEGTMHLVHTRRGEAMEEEDVAISADELAAITLIPPSLDFVEKDQDGTVSRGLLKFASEVIDALPKSAECVGTALLDNKSWKAFGFDTAVCAGLNASKYQRIGTVIKLMYDSAECAGGAGSGVVAVGLLIAAPPVGAATIGALGATAVKGLISCKDLGEDYDALKSAFSPVLPPPPTEPSGARWEIEVDPPFSVEIVAPAVVALGARVELHAIVTGGEAPFESAWKIDGVLSPIESLYLTDVPTHGTTYEVAVQYRVGGIPYVLEAAAGVAVCGDRDCWSVETPELCPVDCAGADAGGMDGGAADAGDAGNPDAGVSLGDGGLTDGGGASSVVGQDSTGAPQVPYRGLGTGEPHLTTFDGVRYDLQPEGELTLVASTDGAFEVQVRTAPYGNSDRVAIIVATAIKVAGQRITIDVGGHTRVNGAVVVWSPGSNQLENGLKVYRSGLNYTVVSPDGTQVRIAAGVYINVGVHLADALQGHVMGLLGNSDGVRAGDLVVRGGSALPDSPTFAYFYKVFVESWRVTQGTSLFDYAVGESTETFTNRNFPVTHATSAGLSSAARDAARAACIQGGVSDDWLEECIIDVGYTGNTGFIESLRGLPKPGSSLTIKPNVDQTTAGALLNPAGGPADGALVGTLGATAQTFTITANAGQTILLRLVDLGSGTFTPTLRVHDESGAIVAQASGAAVGALSYAVPSTASYTVELYDGSGGMNRDFVFYYALTPGANEGGVLTGSTELLGTIELGDLDSYTFDGQSGQTLQVRVAGVAAASFTPAFWLYGPTGTLVLSGNGALVAGGSVVLPNAGRYTLVLSDYSTGYAGAGDYTLAFALAPGANEGGVLTGSTELQGTIQLGDLDSYTFDGQSGQTVQVRVADVAGASFTPAFWLYGPTGTLVLSGNGGLVAGGSVVLPNAGRYTLVLSDYSTGYAGAGDYTLAFALAPGANEGGVLTGSTELQGTIQLGDLDSYTFDGQSGQTVQVRVADVAGASFTPAFWLYGPTGTLVLSGNGGLVAGGSVVLPNAGRYTLVLSDYSTGYAGAGDYTLAFALAPGANEGGALVDGSGTIALGDIDSFTLTAPNGTSVSVQVTASTGGAFTPAVSVYGAGGALITSSSGADQASVTFRSASPSPYTVMVYDYSTGYAGTGDYQITHTLTP